MVFNSFQFGTQLHGNAATLKPSLTCYASDPLNHSPYGIDNERVPLNVYYFRLLIIYCNHRNMNFKTFSSNRKHIYTYQNYPKHVRSSDSPILQRWSCVHFIISLIARKSTYIIFYRCIHIYSPKICICMKLGIMGWCVFMPLWTNRLLH